MPERKAANCRTCLKGELSGLHEQEMAETGRIALLTAQMPFKQGRTAKTPNANDLQKRQNSVAPTVAPEIEEATLLDALKGLDKWILPVLLPGKTRVAANTG